MHKENLRQHLSNLHTELASVKNLDEEMESLLRQVADDIEGVIADRPVEASPVKDRLGEMAVSFEAEHPQLAGILTQLADTLSKLGI